MNGEPLMVPPTIKPVAMMTGYGHHDHDFVVNGGTNCHAYNSFSNIIYRLYRKMKKMKKLAEPAFEFNSTVPHSRGRISASSEG
jgi:hypothetical protein